MSFPRHYPGLLLVGALVLLGPRTAVAQVSAEVEIRDGTGRALVRNTFRSPVDVEIALWESDETGERVELLRKADANLWPVEFRLQPGETRTVRMLLEVDAYGAGALLRLETRFVPVEPRAVEVAAEASAADGTAARASAVDGPRAHIRIVTRILSKAWVR